MPDSLPIMEVEGKDRLIATQQILERAARESLSVIEQYVLQKAIGLFLLGERHTSWGMLHTRAAIDGLSDLSPKPKLTDDESDEIRIALDGLEQKGLLQFAYETPVAGEILYLIAAVRDEQIVLLKNKPRMSSIEGVDER